MIDEILQFISCAFIYENGESGRKGHPREHVEARNVVAVKMTQDDKYWFFAVDEPVRPEKSAAAVEKDICFIRAHEHAES